MFKTYNFDKFNSFYRKKYHNLDIQKIIPFGLYCNGFYMKNIDDKFDENTKKLVCPYNIRITDIEQYCLLCDKELDDNCKICSINRRNLHFDSMEIIEQVYYYFKENDIICFSKENIKAIYNRLANIYIETISTINSHYNYKYSFEYCYGETKLKHELVFNTDDKYKIFIAMNMIIEYFEDFYIDLINERDNIEEFRKNGFLADNKKKDKN